MSTSNMQIKSMAKQLRLVASEVSNVLGVTVTVDQLLKIEEILNSGAPVAVAATKVEVHQPVESEVEPVKGFKTGLTPAERSKLARKRVMKRKVPTANWGAWDFAQYADGEVHTVVTNDIRRAVGWDKFVPNRVVLKRFDSMARLVAAKMGAKVEAHNATDLRSMTLQFK